LERLTVAQRDLPAPKFNNFTVVDASRANSISGLCNSGRSSVNIYSSLVVRAVAH